MVPRCRENGEMDAVRITSLDMLQKGSYGIMEPPVDLPDEGFENIDFAVVPALAFTKMASVLGREVDITTGLWQKLGFYLRDLLSAVYS